MAEDWTDIDRENERIHNQLNARKAGSAMTKDAAYQQYTDYIGSVGGHSNAETDRDFENAWRQSAEASEFGGAGVDRANTWSANFETFKPRLQQRWQEEQGQDAYDDSGRYYGGGSGGGSSSPVDAWTKPTTSAPTTPYEPPTVVDPREKPISLDTPKEDPNAARIRILLEEGMGRDKERADQLWKTLSGRAAQGLNIDRNDPVIRAQADAYRANEDRASREMLADLAERGGPLANLTGEQRLASERVGQRTGAFESELMGRELTSRRDEIAQALAGMGGMLTADQQRSLTQQLALLDNAIKEKQLATTQRGQDIDSSLGWGRLNLDTELGRGRLGLDERQLAQQESQFGRTLDQDWRRVLMQNEQFLRQLGFDTSRFASDDDYRRSYGI